MKKRSLTFVISYLLLAAFLGSAEAKIIDTNYPVGAGAIQLAAVPSKTWNDVTATGWTLEGLNFGMEWVLAFYFGTNYSIDLETTPSNSTEVSPTSENEEILYLGEEMRFGYNTGGGLGYVDPLVETSTSTDQKTPASSAPSAADKVPAVEYKTKLPLNYFFIDPPIITINTGSIPRKDNPANGNTPSIEEPYVNDKPVIPPEIVASREPDPITVPTPITILPIEFPNKPQKPGKDPRPQPGPKVELPIDGIVNSPAPVPEPATMLLFSAGIAGLAIGGARRKKKADTEKRG